ncbi:MAG: group II intron reverse transcriptase/maturase [Candidatus Cloacimonadota bacterium]|nr:group II intron reverse transcriptase/maturase [Candidatus Cloacimonadota bacterium]
MSYPEMKGTWFKLSLISERAVREPELQFTSLAHLLNKSFLEDCYNSLNRNKAVGIDNVNWAKYGENLEENLEKLVGKMKAKKYKPIPAKRVYIPKNETEKRPLGISAIENKIVETGIKHILESIYEEDFYDFSYGFRPRRSCHQALAKVDSLIMNNYVNHIVEADIKGFFDNVPHLELMKFLGIRIKDSSLLHLIEKFLKAGYIDDGLLVTSEKGTPQGSILSPILANIYLHYVLDDWFEKVVKQHINGFCDIVRYADDFICVVQSGSEASRVEKALKNRFNKYGLEIHPTKSRTISFGRYEQENAKKQKRRSNTFDFLGFTHFCDKTRNGNFKVGRKTSGKKFRAKMKAMNIWLKSIRNVQLLKDWWKILNAKLRGHFQYYGVSGNFVSISKYYQLTMRLTRKWINRRSQKQSMNWKQFNQYLEKYPIVKPKIMFNLYALSHTM